MLPVLGNVEKTIFTGPEPIHIHIPQLHPNIDTLQLETLTPSNFSIRRSLNPSKPGSPKGSDAWFLLDQLKQKKRYEVRICWLATVSGNSVTTSIYKIPGRSSFDMQPSNLPHLL